MTKEEIKEEIENLYMIGSSVKFEKIKGWAVMGPGEDYEEENIITVTKVIGGYRVQHKTAILPYRLNTHIETISNLYTDDLDRVIDDINLFYNP